ncbi:hypothetical protein HK100_006889 [Physocladia obscura]|uniref:GATA-type domain-containing protein n=1 Tax=Physocladia obscura TaxID=109957 RepID=A0AAD5T593_9FUNG|nr:hypothetical protein HK100_006889 [Physocladia obscura]
MIPVPLPVMNFPGADGFNNIQNNGAVPVDLSLFEIVNADPSLHFSYGLLDSTNIHGHWLFNRDSGYDCEYDDSAAATAVAAASFGGLFSGGAMGAQSHVQVVQDHQTHGHGPQYRVQVPAAGFTEQLQCNDPVSKDQQPKFHQYQHQHQHQYQQQQQQQQQQLVQISINGTPQHSPLLSPLHAVTPPQDFLPFPTYDGNQLSKTQRKKQLIKSTLRSIDTMAEKRKAKALAKKLREQAKNLVCYDCGATSTPFWRRTHDKKHPLCNACGLFVKKYGKKRVPFFTDSVTVAPSALADATINGAESARLNQISINSYSSNSNISSGQVNYHSMPSPKFSGDDVMQNSQMVLQSQQVQPQFSNCYDPNSTDSFFIMPESRDSPVRIQNFKMHHRRQQQLQQPQEQQGRLFVQQQPQLHQLEQQRLQQEKQLHLLQLNHFNQQQIFMQHMQPLSFQHGFLQQQPVWI